MITKTDPLCFYAVGTLMVQKREDGNRLQSCFGVKSWRFHAEEFWIENGISNFSNQHVSEDKQYPDNQEAPPPTTHTHPWTQMRLLLEGETNMQSLKEASVSRAWLVTNREVQLPGPQQSTSGSNPLCVSKCSRPSVNLERGGENSISSAKSESIQSV